MNCKKYFPFLFLYIVVGISLYSCQKDYDYFIPDSVQPPVTGDTNWVSTITADLAASQLQLSLALPLFVDSFILDSSARTITTASGFECTIQPNSLMLDSNTMASGNIHLASILLKSKGNMIRMNKPTVSANNLLISGGSLFVQFKKDSNLVQVATPRFITIKYSFSNPSQPLNLYYGNDAIFSAFNWISNPLNNIISITNQGYQISTNVLGWLGAAITSQNSGGFTKVQPVLSNQYTNANTLVYLVFNDQLSIVKLHDFPLTKKFQSIDVPSGKNVTLVVFSKQGNNYYFGTASTTTLVNVGGLTSVQSVNITPSVTTLETIKQTLDSL